MANTLKQASDMHTSIDTLQKMQNITVQMAATTHSMVGKMKGTGGDLNQLRDNIADFDAFFRPMRNYLYWEPHCFDIPVCWSIRSVFDTLDGVDKVTDDLGSVVNSTDQLDKLVA